MCVSISYFIYYTQFFAKCQYFLHNFVVWQKDFTYFTENEKTEASLRTKYNNQNRRLYSRKEDFCFIFSEHQNTKMLQKNFQSHQEQDHTAGKLCLVLEFFTEDIAQLHTKR